MSVTTPTISRHSTSPGFTARKLPNRSRAAHRESLANRILAGPVTARRGRIDDGDQLAVGSIVFGEESSLRQR